MTSRTPAGLDRRRLLARGGSAALLAIAAGAASMRPHPAGAQTPPEPVVDREKGFVVQPIARGIHWLFDGAYSSMFMVTPAGVVVCDAPPTTGANIPRAVAEVTDRPITHLVYSHEHVDHIGGSRHLPSDIEIVAHESTAEILARRADPDRRMPTRTFARDLRLEVGGEVLDLSHKGINHSVDTIFIHAPRQKVLMVVDIVYPGWMPYKNLGVAVDIPGFVDAHRHILNYEFDALVAGHVSRVGTRADVETQLELIVDLVRAAEDAYALSFGAFLADNPPAAPGTPGPKVWDLHDDYEDVLVDRMVAALMPKWRGRLQGTQTYLRDNCWAMMESFVVQGAPDIGGL